MPEVPEFPRYLEEQAYKSLLKRVEMCQNDFDWGWDREPKDRRHAMNACLDLERAIERIATLTQQLAEAEARVRVLVNTLDVERDAFRNMQMQKEALEARVKELEEHSAVCEKHPLYQCALVTEEGVDWVLEFDDSGTGPETILEDARAALADERKEAPHGD